MAYISGTLPQEPAIETEMALRAEKAALTVARQPCINPNDIVFCLGI